MVASIRHANASMCRFFLVSDCALGETFEKELYVSKNVGLRAFLEDSTHKRGRPIIITPFLICFVRGRPKNPGIGESFFNPRFRKPSRQFGGQLRQVVIEVQSQRRGLGVGSYSQLTSEKNNIIVSRFNIG